MLDYIFAVDRLVHRNLRKVQRGRYIQEGLSIALTHLRILARAGWSGAATTFYYASRTLVFNIFRCRLDRIMEALETTSVGSLYPSLVRYARVSLIHLPLDHLATKMWPYHRSNSSR